MYTTEFSERFTEGKALSLEDKQFLGIMRNGVRKVDGRYEAPIPFRDGPISLPNNKDQALRRLYAHVGRMRRDSVHRDNYVRNMDKLIMQCAEKCGPPSPHETRWYIPHHGVYHKDKPLRIVFDCSASYRGVSLNDHLLQGPDLVNLLIGLMLRFRKESLAYSADLEACFHQITIPPSQRQYFCFLWWEDGDYSKPVVEYKMNKHLFGAISSPSIANYIVKRLGTDNIEKYGEDVRKVMEREFYVDNLLSSSSSTTDAISLLNQTISAC